MKTLITILILFVAVGCGKTEIVKFGEETNFMKLPVVGSYYATGSDEEGKAVSTKIVFHENGNVEWFQSDKLPQAEVNFHPGKNRGIYIQEKPLGSGGTPWWCPAGG